MLLIVTVGTNHLQIGGLPAHTFDLLVDEATDHSEHTMTGVLRGGVSSDPPKKQLWNITD